LKTTGVYLLKIFRQWEQKGIFSSLLQNFWCNDIHLISTFIISICGEIWRRPWTPFISRCVNCFLAR